jgi:hypothetical protein
MEEACVAVDRFVDSLANEQRRSYRGIAAHLRFGQQPSIQATQAINERQHAVGLLAMVDPDKLRKVLLAAAAEADNDPGISTGDRRQALAAIDAKLLEIEHAEEAAIREAAGAGMIIARRADADPMAVLGD